MNKLLIKKILFIIIVYGIPSFILLFGLYTLSYLKEQNRNMKSIINNVNLNNKINEVNNLLDSNNFKGIKKLNILLSANDELDKISNTISDNYNDLLDEYSKKNKELNDLTTVKKFVSTINTSLKQEYNSIRSHTIKNVVTINQFPKYPNGCELVALDILLKYYGVNVTVDEIISATPIGKTPYYSNGVLYGGNPNYEFLGNPKSYSGWGIWDKGLANVANKFKPNVINGTGMDFEDILKLVYNDRPVIVWTSISLIKPYVANKWTDPKTGEQIVWKRFNHAVVVIGYNDNEIIISDPINGKIRYMNRKKFIDVYNFMDKKVIYY